MHDIHARITHVNKSVFRYKLPRTEPQIWGTKSNSKYSNRRKKVVTSPSFSTPDFSSSAMLSEKNAKDILEKCLILNDIDALSRLLVDL